MAADNKLTKSAGEHHVCAMLARFGWASSLTRDGIERTDILGVQTLLADGARPMIEVQVKAASPNPRPSWPLGRKGTIPAVSSREWYVLVLLQQPTERPRSFVVPRDHVAAATWIRHMSWLNDPNQPEGRRNAGIDRARVDLPVWLEYEDAWELLTEPTTALAIRLPAWMREKLDDPLVGLPPGHPWLNALPDWPSCKSA